jgi:ubiquinol-cytochrome c reductase iron-sulfur subunit
MRFWQWIVAFVVVKLLRRKPPSEDAQQAFADSRRPEERIVPAGTPDRRAENIVLVLLGVAVLFALGFIVVYGEFSPNRLPDQLLGICLGLCLVFIGAALTVVAKRLVVTEEVEDEYPEEHPEAQREVAQILHESGSRISRKKLLLAAGAGTGGILGLAALTPVLSLGPSWDTGPLDRTPWRAGRRLVDEAGQPLRAADVFERSFYTAFPEGADPENIGSPVVVVRVDPVKLQLPPGRSHWAPEGILAYSKICTHAGCAIALYRKPTFTPVEPNAALICPCHYSTFDVFTGGTVIYGPAGRPLPQLPLEIDPDGYLRAAGNYSARVGPGWWNVRSLPT